MNYQHIFHAGNFADVFKHAILTLLLERLSQKDKPCVYIDTHSGAGQYDLADARAQKTAEASLGVMELLAQAQPIPELARYLSIIKPYLDQQRPCYPGSPLIMQSFQRELDHLILNELHPDAFAKLRYVLHRSPRTHLHQRDAYEFLPAIMPPTPRRGLVLIDPPYEKKTEYSDIANAVKKSLKRFEVGVYAIWYPIVDRDDTKQIAKLVSELDRPVLGVELMLEAIFRSDRGLKGTGMLIVNPPWQIEQPIDAIAQYLCHVFARSSEASVRLYTGSNQNK